MFSADNYPLSDYTLNMTGAFYQDKYFFEQVSSLIKLKVATDLPPLSISTTRTL